MNQCPVSTGQILAQISILTLLLVLVVISTINARKVIKDADKYKFTISTALISQILFGLGLSFFIAQFLFRSSPNSTISIS